jgi:hypothetical protein
MASMTKGQFHSHLWYIQSVRYQSTFDVMGLCAATKIDKLEWGHFNWPAGTINVTPTEFLHVKSETSARTVWLPTEMLEAETNEIGPKTAARLGAQAVGIVSRRERGSVCWEMILE